jgi:hypothetical protein
MAAEVQRSRVAYPASLRRCPAASTAVRELPISPISDAEVRGLVVERLARLGQEFPMRIHVHVENGDVLLRGAVSSAYERLVILHVVSQLNVVQHVEDKIVIGLRRGGNDIEERTAFHPTMIQGVALAVVLLGVGAAFLWGGPRLLSSRPRPVPALVTYGGKPAQGTMLTLYPVKNSRADALRPRGRVREDGSVEWTTSAPGDGLPQGSYIVTALWRPAVIVDGEPRFKPNVLPGIYLQPGSSPLRLDVTVSDQEMWSVDLKR